MSENDNACFSPSLLKPLISIVITCYNYERYIDSAIESVLSQDYEQVECIVVDDCSTDSSFRIADDFVASHKESCVRLIKNEKNLGQMGSMRAGLNLAQGTFVSFLDADDLLLPNFAAQHIRAHLNASYPAGISSSDTIQIDGEGRVIEGTYSQFPKERDLKNKKPLRLMPKIARNGIQIPIKRDPNITFVGRTIDGWHGVATSSFMFRKDMLNLIVPRETDQLRLCADCYFVKFAHFITGTLLIDSAFSCYRLHGQNGWAQNPRIGGQHNAGSFTLTDLAHVTELMIRHLNEQRTKFEDVLSVRFTKQLIQRLRRRVTLYKIGSYFYD